MKFYRIDSNFQRTYNVLYDFFEIFETDAYAGLDL